MDGAWGIIKKKVILLVFISRQNYFYASLIRLFFLSNSTLFLILTNKRFSYIFICFFHSNLKVFSLQVLSQLGINIVGKTLTI